jgi:hypothetical protein
MLEKTTSLLDDDVRYKIRTMYLEGKNIKQIQEILNVPENTWYSCYYRDTQGFRCFVDDLQLQAMRLQARKNLQEFATMDLTELNDPRFAKLKYDASQFIAETLDKDVFSKKKEEDSDKGDAVTVNIVTNKAHIPLLENEDAAQ